MSTATSINMDLVGEYVKLKRERDEAEGKAKYLGEHMRAIEADLLEQFATADVKKISRDDCTVYVNRQVWASAKDHDSERLCVALKAVAPQLVKESINSQQLSSYVREITADGENPLPENLANAIELREVFSLRVRKS